MWADSTLAHYQAFLWRREGEKEEGREGGRERRREGGSLAKATAPASGLLAHSPVTLISFLSTHLGSQDANHIPKASQTIFLHWKASNMCSPFGTKRLSSVSVTFHRQESTGLLLFCLPLLSRAAERRPPSQTAGQGCGLRRAAGIDTEAIRRVWHLPLLPKLKCHIGNLRDTDGDMGTLDRSVGAAFPASLLFVSFPVLAYCFVGKLLRCSSRGIEHG
jgi:hypothetical protein